MRDFKRHVKGIILEKNNTSVVPVPDIDNGAIFQYENKIKAFLNNTLKEMVSIVRDTTSNLLLQINQGTIVDGDMVFNTTQNTYQQVVEGQLENLGGGETEIDPELVERIANLESTINSVLTNQDEIDDNLAIARAELYDLINLTGVAENNNKLGPFTGAYLNDSSTIKQALQALETAVEVGLQTQTADLSSIINQVTDLGDSLAAESANRVNGDATTLAAAKAYTDVEIADLVAQAPVTSDTLAELSQRIDTLVNNVSELSGTDTTLANQINTITNSTAINVTSIPNAITSANSYTDQQITLALSGGSESGAAYEDRLGLFYYENFESIIKGALSGGAIIIDIAENPLKVLSGNKSLLFPHSSPFETFTSSVIDIPNICKFYDWVDDNMIQITQFFISLQQITTVSFINQFPETPSALLRIYDITNNQYLILNPSDPSPQNTWSFIRGPGNIHEVSVQLVGHDYNQIRIEINSNFSSTGDTVIDSIACSVRPM